MGNTTARLMLPLIEPGQAQKELAHNEALVLLDMAVHALVEAIGLDTPPAAPAEGQAWITGAMPGGAWTGHALALAGWTEGGWRFVAAREGLAVWDRASATAARFVGGSWRRAGVIAAPAGGTTVDAEARATLAALLVELQAQGLVAG
ncbi:DUF2793 domain-containing protein [Sphingomonas aurea]